MACSRLPVEVLENIFRYAVDDDTVAPRESTSFFAPHQHSLHTHRQLLSLSYVNKTWNRASALVVDKHLILDSLLPRSNTDSIVSFLCRISERRARSITHLSIQAGHVDSFFSIEAHRAFDLGLAAVLGRLPRLCVLTILDPDLYDSDRLPAFWRTLANIAAIKCLNLPAEAPFFLPSTFLGPFCANLEQLHLRRAHVLIRPLTTILAICTLNSLQLSDCTFDHQLEGLEPVDLFVRAPLSHLQFGQPGQIVKDVQLQILSPILRGHAPRLHVLDLQGGATTVVLKACSVHCPRMFYRLEEISWIEDPTTGLCELIDCFRLFRSPLLQRLYLADSTESHSQIMLAVSSRALPGLRSIHLVYVGLRSASSPASRQALREFLQGYGVALLSS